MKKNFLILLLALTPTAHAATYNFYFNNTEQGNNSTAAPSVVVKDEKGNEIKPESTSSENLSTPNQPESLPANGESIVSELPEKNIFAPPQWRIALGSIHNTSGIVETEPENNSAYRRSQSSLFYFPNPKLGIGFQVGRFMGPEAEFVPFGMKQGFGKVNFALSTAILSDLSSPNSRKDFLIGGQFALNILRDLGLGVSLRFTPYERNNQVLALANWNLHLLF